MATLVIQEKKIVSAAGSFSVEPISPIPPFSHDERNALLRAVEVLNGPVEELCEPVLKRHPEIEKALELFNAHPLRRGAGVDLKTGQAITDPRDNIGRHCLKVADGVVGALAPLLKAGILTDDQLLRAEKGALGHDCLKSLEIDRRNEAIAKGGDIAGAYSKEAYETEERVLGERGVTPDLLRSFISFGQNTGHRSIAKFLRVQDGRPAGVHADDLPALAAHVIDSLTYSTKPAIKNALHERECNVFVPAAERMILSMFHHQGDDLLVKPQGYPFLWSEGLALSSDGRIVEVKDIHCPPEGATVLGSYAFLQIYTAKEGARVLSGLIGLKNDDEPDIVLCNFLNNRPH